ncbi:MAG: retroviral-like aspartic protease family protein [Syntrophobacteraceae bacterium]
MISLRLCIIFICAFFLAAKAGATEIQLQEMGGVYTLPVRVNGVITLNFILDSGASEVCIPSDILPLLLKAGTVTDKDFLPGKNLKLADGSILRSSRFTIKVLNIGGYKIFNVPAVITPGKGFPLLGQSFLNRIESWTLDNRTHKLTLSGVAPAPEKEPAPVSQVSTAPAKAAKSTANDSQPPSPAASTTQPEPESARKLIPRSVHPNTKSQSGPDGQKPLIEPRVNH